MRHVLSLGALFLLTATTWAAEKVKWEYAELQIRTTRAAPAEGEEAPRTVYTLRWLSGGDEVEYKGYAEFAEKLKAPALKKDASVNASRLHVLNFLGSEGWELLSTTPTTAGFGTTGFGAPGAGAQPPGGPGGGDRGTRGPTGGGTTMLFKRRVQ